MDRVIVFSAQLFQRVALGLRVVFSTMSSVVFFFCGGHIGEEGWWEQQWASSLVSSGLTHEVRIRAALFDGAYSTAMPHWWCQYHEEPWERWEDCCFLLMRLRVFRQARLKDEDLCLKRESFPPPERPSKFSRSSPNDIVTVFKSWHVVAGSRSMMQNANIDKGICISFVSIGIDAFNPVPSDS